MARFDKTDSSAIVTLPVPHHVIIFNGMKLQDWKNYFIQKVYEAIEVADKFNYNKCLKTLILGELCNYTLFRVRNTKTDDHGLAVEFYFEFPNFECLKIFMETLSSIDVVAKIP